MSLFGRPDKIHKEMRVIDLLNFKFSFVSFTFGFEDQLQTSGNTIYLVIENIFHSGLDGTMLVLSHKIKLGEIYTF
jgi:hypothetical protein